MPQARSQTNIPPYTPDAVQAAEGRDRAQVYRNDFHARVLQVPASAAQRLVSPLCLLHPQGLFQFSRLPIATCIYGLPLAKLPVLLRTVWYCCPMTVDGALGGQRGQGADADYDHVAGLSPRQVRRAAASHPHHGPG